MWCAAHRVWRDRRHGRRGTWQPLVCVEWCQTGTSASPPSPILVNEAAAGVADLRVQHDIQGEHPIFFASYRPHVHHVSAAHLVVPPCARTLRARTRDAALGSLQAPRVVAHGRQGPVAHGYCAQCRAEGRRARPPTNAAPF